MNEKRKKEPFIMIHIIYLHSKLTPFAALEHHQQQPRHNAQVALSGGQAEVGKAIPRLREDEYPMSYRDAVLPFFFWLVVHRDAIDSRSKSHRMDSMICKAVNFLGPVPQLYPTYLWSIEVGRISSLPDF